MTKFYCYAHFTPDGKPFYVGKGLKRRAMSFKDRNRTHAEIVSRHGEANLTAQLFPADSEEQALGMERFLITLWGAENLTNVTDGGDGRVSGIVTLPRQNYERPVEYQGNAKRQAAYRARNDEAAKKWEQLNVDEQSAALVLPTDDRQAAVELFEKWLAATYSVAGPNGQGD